MKRALTLSAIVALVPHCEPGASRSENRPSRTASIGAQRISGQVYLVAPIRDAHVKITRIAKGAPDELVGDGKTDEDGKFDITLPQTADGDLVVEVIGDQGGTTIEPVTGVSPISLSETDRLMALALGTQLGDDTRVIVNPLSTLIVARTLAEYSTGASLSTAYTRNANLFSAHVDSASPWLSSPVDLLSAEAPGLSSGVIYSLMSVGLSKHALELGERAAVSDVSIVNTLVILRALVADISSPTDRVFDGKRDGAALNIIGNVFIDQETTRLALAKSVEAFLDSPQNKTGLTSRDASKLLNAIRKDVSELYPAAVPPEDRPDTSQSGAAPLIVVTAPTATQTLGTNDYIVGYAQDADGIASVNVLVDGIAASVELDQTDTTKWTFSFLPTLSSGPHLLEVVAADMNNNVAKKEIQFAYDSQAPVVALVDCTSPNDRERNATVTLGGTTYSDATTSLACDEAQLQDGSQGVFTFADLYEEGTRVTRVRLSVTDQSTIASVGYRVKTDGIEVQQLQPLQASASPATHVINLNLEVLGIEATALRGNSVTTVEVVAIDQNGNKATREFSFHLYLIPTPLHLAQTAPNSAASLQGHTFALGNVNEILDTTSVYDPTKTICGQLICYNHVIPFLHIARFVATNVSSRPITLTRDWMASSEGTMALKRWVYRTHYFSNQAFARNLNNPCPEISEFSASGAFPNGTATADYSTQTCYSMANDFLAGKRSQTLTFTPEWRVYELPSNIEQTGATVTLAPGKQYAVILGVTKLAAPTSAPDVSSSWPSGTAVWNGLMSNWDTLARQPISSINYDSNTYVAGFYRNNRFILRQNGDLHRVWGGLDGFYASSQFNSIYPATTRVRTVYVPATGMNHMMSAVILERGIELAGNLKWRAPVSMSSMDVGFVGTPDHQPTATFAPYFDQPTGVTLCPWANPLCNVDLSGW